jgi:hypothetical protein
MSRSQSVIHRIALIALFTLILNINSDTVAQGVTAHTTSTERVWLPRPQVRDWPEIEVWLSARHSTTSWDERDPHRVKFDLPLLYLHHERDAAGAAERTLEVEITGLAGGTELQIEAVSRHANAYIDEPQIIRERFVLPERPCTAFDPCTMSWTFDPVTALSDLYYLRVKSDTGDLLWSNPVLERPDFAILDTWDVGLGAELGPEYSVRVYYAALFPYARDVNRMDYRLPPEAVPDFIEHQFVPMIEDTWHTQLEEWGFGAPMHPEWDADKVAEIIITDPPFALFDGTGTYTVFTDSQGDPFSERRMWWLSTHSAFGRYDSWENAHRTIFAHEFFHMAQWNILLNTGRPADYWLNTFIEAQAEFAVGVQYPGLELGKDHVLAGSSAYGNSANLFLVDRLNTSYGDLEADPTSRYDLALYWRFLYEQFGDMSVIRAALQEMVRHYQTDVLSAMDETMDATFARLNGPFRTFEESLAAFARANYALRLENGRCAAPDVAACEGRYFDPDEMYVDTPLEAELVYDGASESYSSAIPSSYGMDFIEVKLDPVVQGRSLRVQLDYEGTVARFSVQVWQLSSGDANGAKPRAITPQPEVVRQNADGAYEYVVPNVDMMAFDRLALIITRLDAEETADPAGNYTVVIREA